MLERGKRREKKVSQCQSKRSEQNWGERRAESRRVETKQDGTLLYIPTEETIQGGSLLVTATLHKENNK